MRRKEKLVTDVARLHEVIHNAGVCRLGLADGPKPYIVPLCFGFDGKHLYFHCACQGRKVDILLANPRVCVEFEQDTNIVKGDKPCNWSVRYFTVIVEGIAEVVDGSSEKLYGLNQVMKQYDPDGRYSFTEKELSSVEVYKITMEKVTGKVSGM